MDENTMKQNNYDLDLISSVLVERGTWLAVAEGMGCHTMVRKNIMSGKLEGMYVDNMDYYDLDRVHTIELFKAGYRYIDNHDIIIHQQE